MTQAKVAAKIAVFWLPDRGLQLAQAVARRLLGILITLPLELGLQASPCVRVHRLDVGSPELAVGCRLRFEERRIGPTNAGFGMSSCFGVDDTRTRWDANRRCRDFALSRFEVVLSRIACAPG